MQLHDFSATLSNLKMSVEAAAPPTGEKKVGYPTEVLDYYKAETFIAEKSMRSFKSGSSSHTSASSTSDHLSAFLHALVALGVACIARVAVRNSSYLSASFHRSDCLPWKRLKVEM